MEKGKNSIPLSMAAVGTIFLIVNMVAVSTNHIDDTDETFGYWEPLHYLLFGKGMQTWEYSPEFAIRTYSFVAPFWVLGSIISQFTVTKLQLFLGLRACIGILNAVVSTYFIRSIKNRLGSSLASFTFVYMLASPGIFFTSTALLPSAVTMYLTMLSISCWLGDSFVMSLFWGCVAVLWSGWPFVGVILVPLGVHMLVTTFLAKGLGRMLLLCLSGAAVLVAVAAPPVAIDSFMYGRITWPTLNILVYNAIGGSGDELYGVEPASYYVRNLILNMGVCIPSAVLGGAVLVLRLLISGCDRGEAWVNVTVLMCAALWLAVLFSRPHKEERFLYPAFPLLCLIGAHGAVSVTHFISATLFGEDKTNEARARESSNARPPRSWKSLCNAAMLLAIAVASLTVGSSRIVSNFRNYKGYMSLWTLIQPNHSCGETDSVSLFQSPVLINLLNRSSSTVTSKCPARTLCLGGEWYTFPSHFFVPSSIRLAFIDDEFGGLLPNYFPDSGLGVLGTRVVEAGVFNDGNKENRERYVPLSVCDAVVTSRVAVRDSARSLGFEESFSVDVLDPEMSTSSLARAFFVPYYSNKKNVYKSYSILSKK